MQRATRTNLILLGIAGLLGLAVYLQIGKETAGFEPPLGDLDPALVQRVAASCQGCTARRFERRDGHWWMLEPYALPADDATVERLIGIAASPVRTRRPLSEFDAGRIGLEPPLMHLELDDTQFDIGMTDALRGDRYVRSGDVVAMLPDRFSPFLAASAESELDRSLVPRGTKLASLSINGVGRPDLIDAWSDASAQRINPGDAVSTGIAEAVVDMQLDDGSTVSYHVTRNEDAVIARRSEPSLSYTLAAELATGLIGDDEPKAH